MCFYCFDKTCDKADKNSQVHGKSESLSRIWYKNLGNKKAATEGL